MADSGSNMKSTSCADSLPARTSQEFQKPASQVRITCQNILVRKDRLELTVFVHPDVRFTTPALMKYCLKDYPTLSVHTCRNSKGSSFAAVMNKTSLPHLLEHLIIDIQTHLTQDSEAVFVGTTQWSAENNCKALVSVSFQDDLVALRAVSQAIDYLNSLIGKEVE